MEHSEIDLLLKYLAEIGSFLSKIKYREKENGPQIKVSEAVERYLDGFNFHRITVKTLRRCAVSKMLHK